MNRIVQKRHELLAQIPHTASVLYDAPDSQTLVDRVHTLRLYCDSFLEVWE